MRGYVLLFKERVAHGLPGGEKKQFHIIGALLADGFAPTVGEPAKWGRVGVFEEGEVIYPRVAVVMATHPVNARALGVAHRFEAEAFAGRRFEAKAFAGTKIMVSCGCCNAWRVGAEGPVAIILVLAKALASNSGWRKL